LSNPQDGRSGLAASLEQRLHHLVKKPEVVRRKLAGLKEHPADLPRGAIRGQGPCVTAVTVPTVTGGVDEPVYKRGETKLADSKRATPGKSAARPNQEKTSCAS
jgi:hypothetical protein